MQRSRSSYLAMFVGVPIAIVGCGGPEKLPLPSYDPAGSAAKAMELYDTNGDGFVDAEELGKAPGLKAAMKRLDSNNDGKVSESEVAERVEAWGKMRIGVMSFHAQFLLDGKPLGKADVVFEPDGFMGAAVQASAGQTDIGGGITPTVPKEKRPLPTSPAGMQAGIYKVKVSKVVDGKETIPTRYNSETSLGQEVSSNDPAILNRNVLFKLKSN